MDQAPKLPPRPEKTNTTTMTPLQRHQAMVAQMKASRKMNIGGAGDQAELLTVVPPPPAPSADAVASVATPPNAGHMFSFAVPSASSSSSSRTRSQHLGVVASTSLPSSSSSASSASPSPTLNPVPLSPSRVPSSVFNSFQENVLYSMEPSISEQISTNGSTTQPKILSPPTSSSSSSSSSSAKRPTRITPSNSLPGSALIDLNSLNNNNSSVNDEESARREKARQMIKSMVSAQQQQQQQLVVSPMFTHPATSPLSAVPINVPSMSSAYPQTATLPLGINLVANPLYSNQLTAGSPTKQSLAAAAAFTNNSAAAAIYANLINNNHNNNSSHMINTTTTYPIPINHHHHHQLHHLHQLHHHPHQNIAINHLYFNTQLQQQQQQQQAYSNWAMIHQQQQQQPSSSSFASAASASSPLYSSISTNFQDPIYMNEIFSKIQNNSNNSSASASVQGSPARGVAVDPNSSSPPHLKSVLTPTSVFDIRKYTTSQSVIDLFDPLAEVESTTDGQTPSPEYARAARTSSPIPPPPAEKSDAIKNRCLGEAVVPAISVEEDSSEEDEHSVAKKEDEVNNNNNNSRSDRGEAVDGSTSPTSSSKRHSYTNVNDEPINLLYVEERSAKYSPEMQEFCDHLRALYLTVGSAKSTNGASSSPEAPNSGLVWSPRIDMSRAGADKDGGGNSFSLDMYMCSPATKRQLAALNNCSLNSSLSSSVSYSDESEQSERSAIFDVKFNALVYAKLTGEKAPDFSSTLGQQQQQQPSWHSKKLTCALDNVVDIIIYNLATFYGGDGKSEVNYEDFLLKVSGRNEYLVPRSQLASYVYIQQCKKMGQDVTLELVDQTATEFWRPYLRTEADTEYITSARFTPDELLPREAVAAFAGTASAHALNGVLEKLNLSMAKFLSLSTIDAVRAGEGVAVFRELTAQIQALTSILSHVFTTRLYRAIDALLRYHRRHIADYGSGSGGVISSQELMATFTSLAQEVLKAAAEVIHLFSVTFPVNWALPFKHAPRLPAKKEDITRQVESFKLRLDAVCQVAPEWKPAYGWFCLRVVIAHGFSVLEYKYTERKVVDMEHWRLEFDRELVFDTIIANLPREARVDFQLLGIKGNSSVGGSSGTVGAGSKLEVDILAATFFYLFEHENVDERHLFRIGAHLLPLTPFKPPLSIFKSSQSSLSSSNPNQSSAAIYSFEQLDAHVPVIDDSNYVVGYHLAPKAPMIVFSIRQNKPAVQYYYPKVGGGSGGNQNSQRTSQLETSSSTFARSTFDRASLRLDTRVPLTLDRSDSVVSNGSSQGSIGGGGGGLHDQLYGFYGRSTECLEAAERAKIISVIQANPLLPLAEADRALLLKNAEALARFPGAILKLLKAPRWAHGDVRRTYQLLDSFDYFAIHNSSVVTSPQITTGSSAVSPLKMSRSMSFDAAGNASQSSSKQLPFLTAIEALQLLAADYPDRNVRLKAVRWLKHVSPDELCDFLPQLVQSLRYEPYLDCSLIWLLYECALSSSRFCHHLYWLLKSCREGDGRFGGRAAFYLNGLLALCGRRARAMFERQEQLGGRLEAISEEVKAAKDSAKAAVLRQRLETVHEFLECCPISIPLSPSLQVSGLELPQCSYFSSFSRPLKIVLHAAPPYCTSAAQLADAVGPTRPNLMAALYGQRKQLSKIIFKAGDDLRQDMLVMQIVSIINRLWLRAGLDLRLITFAVVNTAHRTGMIEMVSRARTLCQIQREYGVAGNFKRHTISQWLKRHNSGEFEYQMACENFVHSCAGYVVISYLLGFGDRHNDNIMVTTSGHLFHIDFGKFLGKAQTMAGFKRDRAPFVFTADMAYVINGESDRSGKSFQYFVDLCCTCFSQVRANGNFLLSLLAMMIPSNIEGLTPETIMYFHHALMPAETDSKAKEGFYRLIRESLDSFGTQFNFFIHSLAQMKLSGTGGSGTSSAAQVENQNYVVIPGGNTVESGPNENGDVSDGNGGGGGKSNGDNMMDSGMASLESSENSVWRFSFSSTRFSRSQGTEGEITRLEIVSIWKRPPAIDEALGRDYLYKVLVNRATVPESLVYRSYREFGELHERLTRVFPLVRFETAGRGRRPTSATAAEGAKRELQTFLNRLLSLAHEISHSDIVYTFFHAYHRDQQYLDLDRGGLGGGLSVSDFGSSASTVSLSSSSASALPPRSSGPLLPGKIKLAISYSSDGRLNVLVMYARNLVADRNSSPDTYVKLYLMPDPEKRTKRKTKVASKNANPTFMESISYPEMELKELRARKLEVSVWAYDISGNSRIGATMVDLATLDLESKTERWYKLFSAGAAAMQM